MGQRLGHRVLAGFSCPSDDGVLFGSVYYAEGKGNPTILICHGFPGLEKNCDLAQTLHQARFNVITFSYRGAWGSRGVFTFAGTAWDVANITWGVCSGCSPTGIAGGIGESALRFRG